MLSSEHCHYICGQSDLWNTCMITLETCSCDETSERTILHNLTVTNHYQNQNSLSLGTSNTTWAEKLSTWKFPSCWYSWLTFTCATLGGCQGGSQTKVVIRALRCTCQFETQWSTERRSPSLVPAGPPPLQPQFSSLSQGSVTADAHCFSQEVGFQLLADIF